jgi:Hpt domain
MRPFRPNGGSSAPSMANINAETIRRAEEAVSKLADQYRDWVRGDLEKLREFLASAVAGGDARTAAYREVRKIAHDLRGQGTTFGFPLVTRIAQSISEVLKHGTKDDASDTLLTAHVDALATVIEDNLAAADSAPAKMLVATLETAVGRSLP